MKSFLEGRAIVSRDGAPAERAGNPLPSFGSLPSPAHVVHSTARREHGEKKVETVEVEGVVQKIIVTCGCGERIEVHCGY